MPVPEEDTQPEPSGLPRFARVLLDQALDRPLDYLLPDTWADRVEIGSRIRVPLKNRVLLGTVMDLLNQTSVPNPREATALVDGNPMIRPVLLRLAKWMANYYCCGEEVALRAVLPQVIRAAELGPRRLKAVEITRPVSAEEIQDIERRAPKQAAVLTELMGKKTSVLLGALNAEFGSVSQAVDSLCKRGLVRVISLDIERDPYSSDPFLPTAPLTLNSEQEAILQRVQTAIQTPEKVPPLLLHGVTGSGKTEVYLQAVDYAIRGNKTALVLVPEISLTPQTVERFKGRFASMQKEVAVLHSNLSDGERHDEWYKIHSGKARVVIGARSAIFAPLENLGLIVVDEEHENSYKQEEVPRYHARDLAVLRARMEPCAILLGSATPSMESYHNAQTGKYELHLLNERADDRKMPVIRILDMRVQRRRSGPDSIFSVPLTQAVEQRLDRQEQVILFLNRRGYSTSLICPHCGHVCQCPHCSISMTFHREAARLVCHICGHTARAPNDCPSCSEPGIRYSGTGTQKVEEAVIRAFPKARVARMDADAMTRKDSYRETLGKFRAGTIDILVGTQMIAKGLHFPNVTLVGVVNADLGMHIPDFRAGERTFQLLTQVAGRAGRGEMEGEVMVQTFTPFAAAVQFARHNDFLGFWEQEREFRDRFHYPPFARMILLTLRSAKEELAEFTAQTLRRRLGEEPPADTILGEAIPAPLAKAKGFFRFQIAMRGPRHGPLAQHLRAVLSKLPLPEEVQLTVDVDPFQLL